MIQLFKKKKNYLPQVFLTECKYINKEVIRHITKDIDIFSSDSDEEQIESKYCDVILREQFWKCISWDTDFDNAFLKGAIFQNEFFEGGILKMYFMEGAILKMYFQYILKLIADWVGCWLDWHLKMDADWRLNISPQVMYSNISFV